MKTNYRPGSEGVFDAPGSQPGLRRRMRGEARRVSSQHRQLDEFFEMVVAALERDSQEEASSALRRFRDALEAHLTLEDELFFPALKGLDPVLGSELLQLAREHGEFRRRIEELEQLLGEGISQSFSEGLESFADQIAEHERYEEQLIARISSRAP